MIARRKIVVAAVLAGLIAIAPVQAQFTAEDIAARPAMESVLATAEVVDSVQLPASEGVTQPYRVTLGTGGQKYDGLWKNPSGRQGGFVEGWKYEIAAYELDK
jgi:hypothetical protein